MRRPEIARAMTSCWICSVPSKPSDDTAMIFGAAGAESRSRAERASRSTAASFEAHQRPKALDTPCDSAVIDFSACDEASPAA